MILFIQNTDILASNLINGLIIGFFFIIILSFFVSKLVQNKLHRIKKWIGSINIKKWISITRRLSLPIILIGYSYPIIILILVSYIDNPSFIISFILVTLGSTILGLHTTLYGFNNIFEEYQNYKL